MKRRRLDPRQQHDGIVRGLTQAHLARIQRIARWRQPIDEAFFTEVVWWWRPLGEILEKQTPFEATEARNVSFFPTRVFRLLQFAYLTGNVRALVNLWHGEEIAARHEGYSANYPGFNYVPLWTANFPRWRDWRRPTLTLKVDLGRRNAEILRDATKAIDRLRRLNHAKTGLLGHGPAKAFFESDAFRACELIDQETFSGFWPTHRLPDADAKAVIRRAQRAHLQKRSQ